MSVYRGLPGRARVAKRADVPQENKETGFRRIIRTFDPEVPGYFFWPIIFGVAAILQQVVIRL